MTEAMDHILAMREQKPPGPAQGGLIYQTPLLLLFSNAKMKMP